MLEFDYEGNILEDSLEKMKLFSEEDDDEKKLFFEIVSAMGTSRIVGCRITNAE